MRYSRVLLALALLVTTVIEIASSTVAAKLAPGTINQVFISRHTQMSGSVVLRETS